MELTKLPIDLVSVIALNMDYDDLLRSSITSKQLYEVISDPIFWLNKIYHDFGLTTKLDITEKLKQFYIKIETILYKNCD